MSQNKQDKGFRYSIRKRSVGVCGVAIATFLLGSGLVFQTNVVKATEPSIAAVAGENIAAHKSASQSSTYYDADASRAVDGNLDNVYRHHSVTHTNFEDHAWWKVDLAKEEGVGTVRIYNRGDSNVGDRLSNFDVILLDKDGKEVTRQHVDTLNNQPKVDVQFSGVNARYVKIELNKSKTPLSLAEVEVYRAVKEEKVVADKKTENKVKTENKDKKDYTAELNNYLFGLNYDKLNILTRKGEALENYTNTSTKQQGNEFVVVEKVKKNLSNGSADVAINGNGDIFLGALFKANQDLLENKPQQISLDRSKGSISVDLPGMVGGDSYVDANPTASGMQEGVNTLLNRWHEKYAAKNPAPARMQYESTSAYSMNQLKAKFGSDFEKVGVNLKIDFEAVNKGEKQVEVVDFKQIYYTANFDAPKNPSDVFAPGVTVDQLKARGIDGKTPPVYVSSVSYGRQMYVKFETTSKSTELKAAINAVIKGVPIKPDSEWA
ncbi:MAG: thiol-activated cytolysin family protein, partial [Streptococcus mitis]|nr:thiol-activated cytolysin family protein [Streptococcus mitis]